MNFKLLLTIVLGIMCFGCSSDDTEDAISPKITLNSPNLSFDSASFDAQNISFSSALGWNIVFDKDSDKEWIELSQYKGNPGDITIAVTVVDNEFAIDRTATLSIVSENISQSVIISQTAAEPSLSINSSSKSVSSEADSFSFELTANGSWFAAESDDWLEVTPSSGDGSEPIVIEYDANVIKEERIGRVTFTQGNIERIFTLTQTASGPSLSIDNSSKTVSSASDSFTFNLSSNGGWTVAESDDWFEVLPSSGDGDKQIIIEYDANPLAKERVGTATFTHDNIEQIFTLTQSAASALLSIDSSSKGVSSASDSFTIELTSNGSWSAEESADWFEVLPSNGDGDKQITIEYEANTLAKERIGTATFTHGNVERTFTLTQASANPTLTINSSSKSVSSESSYFTFDLTANGSWSAVESDDWLRVVPSNGDGDKQIKIEYDVNPHVTERIGTVTFTHGSVERIFTLTQAAAGPFLSINSSSKTVSHASDSFTFNLSSNVSWTAVESDDWFEVTPSNGDGDKQITIEHETNPTTVQRSGTVSFTHGDIERIFTLTQSGALPSLSIDSNSKNVSSSSDSFTLELTSNGSWTAVESDDWFEVTPSGGNGDKQITIEYDENLTTIQRSGTVTFTQGNVDKIFTLTQDGAGALLSISKYSDEMSAASGNTTIDVTTNTSWSAESDSSWARVSPQSGTGNGRATISYDAHSDYTSSRSADIVFTAEGVEKTYTLTQSALEVSLSLSDDSETVSSTSGEYAITVNSNIEWSASETANWLSLTKNGDQLKIMYNANSVPTERNATINIEAGDKNLNFILIQQGVTPTIDLNKSLASLTSSSSSSVSVYVTTNGLPWSVKSKPDWVKMSKSEGTSNSYTYVSSVTNNPDAKERRGIVTFQSGEATADLEVVQNAASATISIDKTTHSAPAKPEPFNVVVTTNNAGWYIGSSLPDWIEANVSSSDTDQTVTLTCEENTSASSRSSYIYFYTGDGDDCEIIRVTQSGQYIFTVSKSELFFTGIEGAQEITVNANTRWSVSDDQFWLSVSRTGTSSGEHTMTVRVQENPDQTDRTGTVSVWMGSGDSQIKHTVEVTQYQKLSTNSLNAPFRSSIHNLPIPYDTSWNATSGTSWCSVSKDGLGNLVISLTKNDSDTPREATITISIGSGSLKEYITITQAAESDFSIDDWVSGGEHGGDAE